MKVNQPKKKAYFYLKMMKNGSFFLVFLKKLLIMTLSYGKNVSSFRIRAFKLTL